MYTLSVWVFTFTPYKVIVRRLFRVRTYSHTISRYQKGHNIIVKKKNARAGGIFRDLLSKLLPQTAEIVDTTLTPINNFEYKNNFS